MNVSAVVLKFIINGGRCLKTSFNGLFHHVSVRTPQTFGEDVSRFHFLQLTALFIMLVWIDY